MKWRDHRKRVITAGVLLVFALVLFVSLVPNWYLWSSYEFELFVGMVLAAIVAIMRLIDRLRH